MEKRYQNVENCNPPFGLPANWLNKTIVLLAVTIEFPYCFIQIQTSENTNNKDKEAGGADLRAVNYGQGRAVLAHENIAPILQLDLHPTLFMGFCYVSHSEATPSLII